ncbi:protein-tyrosine phosphatase-like protein [Myxozyma melibiosi]|uniref:Protein-tyrosine phosphatase-like protein n=1 Tax=Myxozyma melibiosi TaxID=54550 RepID=A0ABR1FA71_9ASCO
MTLSSHASLAPRRRLVASLVASDLAKKFARLNEADSSRVHGYAAAASQSAWSCDRAANEMARNRYSNVLPWDSNRVCLNVGDGANDYINASPICLQAPRSRPRRYIASQGPTRHTTPHFWHMVYAETSDPAVIVMLTRTYEGPREKCYQYWSDGTQEIRSSEFSCRITLTDKYHYDKADCTVRQFKLEPFSPDGSENGNKDRPSKTVYHIYYENWVDFGAPEPGREHQILELCNLANTKNSTDSPLVVHCSAGVGRTGTFITADFLQSCVQEGPADDKDNDDDEALSENHTVASSALLFSEQNSLYSNYTNTDRGDLPDPVFDTVATLRRQRMLMVQSVWQFKFLYQILRTIVFDEHM